MVSENNAPISPIEKHIMFRITVNLLLCSAAKVSKKSRLAENFTAA